MVRNKALVRVYPIMTLDLIQVKLRTNLDMGKANAHGLMVLVTKAIGLRTLDMAMDY